MDGAGIGVFLSMCVTASSSGVARVVPSFTSLKPTTRTHTLNIPLSSLLNV